MSDTTRTFIAVAVPEPLTLKLTRLQSQLAGVAPEARWEVAHPFHITLAFLGDVGHGELNDVCLAVAEASGGFGRFALALEGVGVFPAPDRPRTVWAGVGGAGLDDLKALQTSVTATAARFGYRPEARPFHAHVTLGRFGPGRGPKRDLTPVVSHYRTWHAGPFDVAEAVIFGSTLTREGPVYTPLGRGPFRGRKRGTSP